MDFEALMNETYWDGNFGGFSLDDDGEDPTITMYGLLDLSLRQPGAADHSYSVGQAADDADLQYELQEAISNVDWDEDDFANRPEDQHPTCVFGSDGPDSGCIVMCPSIKTLVNGDCKVVCPFEDCQKLMTRFSSVGRHLETHYAKMKVGNNPVTAVKMVFHCPTPGCTYSKNVQKRTFASLKYLKQHFRKVHEVKNYICPTCKKESFATKTYLDGHQRMCGIKFVCNDCPKVYTSVQALQTHARRRQHSIDLEKYHCMMSEKKKNTPPGSSLKKTTLSLMSIQPKPSSEPGSIARVLLSAPTPLPRLVIDCGTQTGPPVKRGRASASQQCQTEHSAETRTTGTGTHIPSTSRTAERKKSAETQTKRLRISTQTQTAVVTKRKRSSKKIQSASTETQTSFKVLNPPSAPLKPEMIPFPSSQVDLFNYCEPSDEVHSETQTDPNPFFGLNQESMLSELDYFTDSDVNAILSQTSAETQTMMGASSHKGVETTLRPVVDASNLASNEELYFQSGPGMVRSESEIDHYESYLETMDSETQTGSFGSATTFDQLFLY